MFPRVTAAYEILRCRIHLSLLDMYFRLNDGYQEFPISLIELPGADELWSVLCSSHPWHSLCLLSLVANNLWACHAPRYDVSRHIGTCCAFATKPVWLLLLIPCFTMERKSDIPGWSGKWYIGTNYHSHTTILSIISLQNKDLLIIKLPFVEGGCVEIGSYFIKCWNDD